MSEITLTTENFDAEAAKPGTPILVDFWAVWCGPCQMLAPTLSSIAEEYAGSLRVGKVNVDEQPALAARFGITGIPTLLLFQDGQLINTLVGLRSREQLIRELGL